ncbi:acyl-CoA dehydrogenase family protein [Nocardia sp. BMG51109]|uniref:acyl-CoA dehydrogenase family protein n=1 Tax=Nocardia sp. BMG51109 TaxID=1056816 RepID=UPI0004632655|nr:acyl-CoA dehydrogenase family protein [Nocardia sp. BMG51109]
MTVTDITDADIETRPVPRPGSAELAAFVATVAADAERRRAAGGTEPPDAALAEVRRLRLGAVRVPAELGGGGWSVPELFDLLIDLAAADPDVPHILRIHFGFAEELLTRPRTEKKQRWLPYVLDGKLFGGALTELNNRPVGNYSYDSTLEPRTDGGYVLNGRKFYSTGSRFSDYIRVSANLRDGALLTAIVPADRQGVEHVDDWDGIGQRHTGSGTTVLTNVVVAEEETLPWRGTDLPVEPRQAFPQLYLHAIAAGILRSVASDAAALLRNRARNFVFGNTEEPRHDPQLLEVVGSLSATAFATESVVRAAAQAQSRSYEAARATGFDADLEHEAALLAAQAKVAIEESALRAAGRIFDVGGASATRASVQLDRHWRNLRTLFSHNPTVYKARALGDLLVNDTPLPKAGHF